MPVTTTVLRRFTATRLTAPSCGLPLRTIHESRTARKQHPPHPVSHDAESYFVDSDDTPPQNTPVYKVDATSDAVESAYEPPSGPWSRAGAGTKEYQTISQDEPYDVPNHTDVKLRYGGRKRYMEDKGPETSKTEEGPKGADRWGRKPEGRT